MLIAALMLLAGIVVVILVYGSAYREYARKGDDYAAGVTVLAAFGTFLPFIGFAAIMLIMSREMAL